MNEQLALCFQLAQKIVQRVKDQYPGCEDVVNCTGGGGIPPMEAMNSILTAYEKHLPGLTKVAAENLFPLEQAVFDTKAAIAPQEADLLYRLFAGNAPRLNKIGQQILRDNALAQAAGEAAVLAGTGGDLIRRSVDLSKEIDPQFERIRNAVAASSEGLLKGLDLGGELSGSERAEISRSLARDNAAMGTSDVPTAIQTITNALKFGKAGEARKQQRQETGARVVGAIGSIAPNVRSGIDPLLTGVGRPSVPNTGAAVNTGINPNIGQSGLGFGNNVLGLVGQTQNLYGQAQSRDAFDRVVQGLGGIGALFGKR
jgi:hypothetical protein